MGRARHVNITSSVHSNAETFIGAAATQGGRVDEHWVDDERFGDVIDGDPKPDLLRPQSGVRSLGVEEDVAACDGLFVAVALLVDTRSMETKLPTGRVQHQVTGGVINCRGRFQTCPYESVERQADRCGIGSW